MAAYDQIGPYKSGVWLVRKGQSAAIVGPSHLPATGSGWQYYWLGSSYTQAAPRLDGAMLALGVKADQNTPEQMLQALQNGIAGKVGVLTVGQGGILGALQSAAQGGVFVTGPLNIGGSAAAGAEGAATEGASGAAGGGAAGAGLKTALQNAPTLLKAASLTALFTDIGTWKGLGLLIAGAVMIILASRQLLA